MVLSLLTHFETLNWIWNFLGSCSGQAWERASSGCCGLCMLSSARHYLGYLSRRASTYVPSSLILSIPCKCPIPKKSFLGYIAITNLNRLSTLLSSPHGPDILSSLSFENSWARSSNSSPGLLYCCSCFMRQNLKELKIAQWLVKGSSSSTQTSHQRGRGRNELSPEYILPYYPYASNEKVIILEE